MADVQMPELGENITQGTVTQWFKHVGETTTVGEALFEVSTDKVDAEVPSPISGTITKILANVGETVAIGGVVATVDSGTDSTTATPSEIAPDVTVQSVAPAPTAPTLDSPITTTSPQPVLSAVVAPATTADPVSVQAASEVDVVEPRLVTSPVVRKLINDLGPDANLVTGTGLEGRITRKDAEKVAFSPDHLTATRTRLQSSARITSASISSPPPAAVGANFISFNKIRKVTGDRMIASKATSPHVMTAIEVDYERIESVRTTLQARWKRDEGFTLTYLPFVARALVQALQEFPQMNASVAEGGLVLHDHVDLSIAVDMNFEGLLAPVLRRVEDKRIGAIAREIADVASRARNAKLRPDELSGGTFTVSNSGPFGTFMVAPVINQPQVAILSTDGVTRRPVVVTDSEGGESIAIHSVGMLVLSWDHRAFDGAYAAAFMRRLKDVLEHHDWASEF
jgi:pyruvate dehydrogenase E2 component (dihydrolipoamide acetyltransferase)